MSAHESKRHTIQTLPDAVKEARVMAFGRGRAGLLPPYATRARLEALHDIYHGDYQALLRGAVSGIAKRIASLPFEVRGDDEDEVAHYQAVLSEAQFGEGWGAFISALVRDALVYDNGAFVEVIAEGHPLLPPEGAPVGLALLDPLCCQPTGDPLYPVLYWDEEGRSHLLHHARVLRLYDMPTTDRRYRGWGDSALSRAISVVQREMLMARYVEQTLDDKPPPGLLLMSNITRADAEQAIRLYEEQRATADGAFWGRNVVLWSLDASQKAEVQSVPFSVAPQTFNYREYTEINVDALALALGVDRQELWQLTGGNIGSATQSELLHLKSRGKTIGYIITELERLLNDLLPAGMEFKFAYRDESEAAQRAAAAQVWANVVATLGAALSPDEARRLLANAIPEVRDVVTNDEGAVVSLTDVHTLEDQPREVIVDDVANYEVPSRPAAPATALQIVTRALSAQTRQAYRDALAALLDQIDAPMPLLSRAAAVNRVEELLARFGLAAFREGFSRHLRAEPSHYEAYEQLLAQTKPQARRIVSAAYGRALTAAQKAELVFEYSKLLSQFYYAGLSAAFVMEFTQVARQGADAQMPLALPEFASRLRDLVRRYGEAAYREGLAAAGMEDAPPDREFERIQQQQLQFATEFAEREHEEGVPLLVLAGKAALWLGTLAAFYHAGVKRGDADGMYEWRLGATEKHCATCSYLHGQRHPMRVWEASGLLPESRELECKGYRCQCSLVRVFDKARGDLSGAPRAVKGLYLLRHRLRPVEVGACVSCCW